MQFPEIPFFFGDPSSTSSTLDEDNEVVWEAENVSLLVVNVAAAVVGTTTLIMYSYSDYHFLIYFCSREINSSFYIIQKLSSHS